VRAAGLAQRQLAGRLAGRELAGRLAGRELAGTCEAGLDDGAGGRADVVVTQMKVHTARGMCRAAVAQQNVLKTSEHGPALRTLNTLFRARHTAATPATVKKLKRIKKS
jgi:hypothetical protein